MTIVDREKRAKDILLKYQKDNGMVLGEQGAAREMILDLCHLLSASGLDPEDFICPIFKIADKEFIDSLGIEKNKNT